MLKIMAIIGIIPIILSIYCIYNLSLLNNDTLQITPNMSMIRCKSNKNITQYELEMYNRKCSSINLAINSPLFYCKSTFNIIIIMADDLGYGDLSSYGNKLTSTPNLDKMAQIGIRFTKFSCQLSKCLRYLMISKNMLPIIN